MFRSLRSSERRASAGDPRRCCEARASARCHSRRQPVLWIAVFVTIEADE